MQPTGIYNKILYKIHTYLKDRHLNLSILHGGVGRPILKIGAAPRHQTSMAYPINRP